MCVLILLYVCPTDRWLLYVCPHTTICVSLCYYMCVLILSVSSYYYMCVLILPYVCPRTAIYVSSYYYICVLILLHMSPHTTIYVSSYYYNYYICVLIPPYASSYYYTCVLRGGSKADKVRSGEIWSSGAGGGASVAAREGGVSRPEGGGRGSRSEGGEGVNKRGLGKGLYLTAHSTYKVRCVCVLTKKKKLARTCVCARSSTCLRSACSRDTSGLRPHTPVA